jgi:outer membrane immunogenic protein
VVDADGSSLPKNHNKEETGHRGRGWLAGCSISKRNAFFFQKGVKMRNFTGLLVLAAALATSSVQAAENNFSWTGFYMGAHGGYGWSNDRHVETFSPPAPGGGFSAVKSSGYLGGGHAGFNWQWGMVVGGVEVDATFPHLNGSSTIQFSDPLLGDTVSSRSVSFDYFGTVRSRIGIVPYQSVLLYATGGLAWAKMTEDTVIVRSNGLFPFSSFTSTPETLFGFAVGAGAEASLGNIGLSNVLLRLEYLHYDFGKQANSSSTSTSFGITNGLSISNGPITLDVVRAGISMKFWPGS